MFNKINEEIFLDADDLKFITQGLSKIKDEKAKLLSRKLLYFSNNAHSHLNKHQIKISVKPKEVQNV